MSQSGYLFLGLTAIVAGLSAVLAYALLRIFAAARAATRDDRKANSETAFMAAAMEDAVRKLRDGERAMKARAEASERLSSEIVASLTSGLLVVDRDGIVRTLNPAGQKMLNLPENRWEMRLTTAVTELPRGQLSVAVRDRVGNWSRVERSFSVGK